MKVYNTTRFSWLDFAIVVVLLAAMLALGGMR